MAVPSPFHARRLDLIVAVLVAVPLAALATYIATYRVDVFYWDQWEMVPVVEKLMRGTLSFSDLWHQHNEHRPFFPRLVLALLARATGWSTSAELALNYVLCVTLLPCLVWGMRQWQGGRDALPAWTWPVIAVVIFSPTQWENWLWGWQLIALMQMVAHVAGLTLLTRRQLGGASVAGASALGVVGTYSLSTGLLYWPIGLAVLLVKAAPARRWFVAIWLLVSAAVIGAYFMGFARNPYLPSPWLNFGSLRDIYHYGGYVVGFLGAPLAPSDIRVAQVLGLAGLLLFSAFTVRAVSQRALGAADALPTSLGVIAVLSGMLVGLGRAPFGSVHALTSHYISSSLWLWVAVLLFLARFSTDTRPPFTARTRRLASASVAAVVTICVCVMGWPTAMAEGRQWHARLSPARDVLAATNTNLPPLKALYPVPEIVIQRRHVLQEFHMWVFRDGPAAVASPPPLRSPSN